MIITGVDINTFLDDNYSRCRYKYIFCMIITVGVDIDTFLYDNYSRCRYRYIFVW